MCTVDVGLSAREAGEYVHAQQLSERFTHADNLLLSLRFRRVPQPMDGSCYFHSVADRWNQLPGVKRCDSLSLRFDSIEVIKINYDIYVGGGDTDDAAQISRYFLSNEDLSMYCTRMSRATEWVDEAVILASSWVLGVCIRIYQIVGTAQVVTIHEFNPCESDTTLTLFYNGVHYDSLESI